MSQTDRLVVAGAATAFGPYEVRLDGAPLGTVTRRRNSGWVLRPIDPTLAAPGDVILVGGDTIGALRSNLLHLARLGVFAAPSPR